MRMRSLAAVLALSVLPACFGFEMQAHAGYAQLALDGDLGYRNGTAMAAIDQDLKQGFGLGDDQGSPYVRAKVDLGIPVWSISAFTFSDEGTGTLTADFGDLTASTNVVSEFDMTSIKGAYAFDISLPVPGCAVHIQPGIAVDYFDLEIKARDEFGIISESVDLNAPIPMGFLRGQVDFWKLSAVAEVGYMAVDVDDVSGSLLDIEAQLVVRPTALVDLFVGYRSINLQVDGDIDDDSFDTDLTIAGFMVGGGITF